MRTNEVRNIVRNRRTSSQAIENTASASGSVKSLDGPLNWWSQEEARLYESWASTFENLKDGYRNPYFDYYYTGQDVQVTIEGLDPADVMNIYQFGYQIQQQKQPVYGFWSYTYDGMLRGTRIITGAFSLVVDEPYGFASKIAKAAKVRAAVANTRRSLNPVYGIDEDEANIDRYWRRHVDPNLQGSQQHLFSIHPPFNFVIQYGIQSTSLSSNHPTDRSEAIRESYRGQAPLSSNYNERLVEHQTPQLNHKILLENVELISKSLEYNVNGDPLLENYTFMARDERVLTNQNSTTGPVNKNSGSRSSRIQ